MFNTINFIYCFSYSDSSISAIEVFYIQDILTDTSIRDKYKELILNSTFIFLDVDPHNGTMEYDFYLFLKENNYNGFVICDDIWYFKDMRDNFWYNIQDEFKYDISNLIFGFIELISIVLKSSKVIFGFVLFINKL